MSINIGDNFKYLGKKFLDDRETFNTLTEMKNCKSVPDGFITFCKEDGKRYEYLNINVDDPITGKWSEFKMIQEIPPCSYVGDTEPDDDNVIWFDTGEGSSSEITYDNPIINELFACIRTLQKQVQQLQADVEYLKEFGGGSGNQPSDPDKPDVPEEPGEEIVDVVLALEDGGLFMLEDGGFMILEEGVVVEKPDYTNSILALEDGGLFMLEDGGFMILEEDIDVEKPDENTQSLLALEDGGLFMLEDGRFMLLEENIIKVNEAVMLLENGAHMLFENNSNILLERQ